jgi:putative transposase
LSYQDTTARLATLKHSPEYEWLREADSQVLQQSLKDLDRAFRNFFDGRCGYPRFKSGRAKQAIRYPQRVKKNLEAKRIYLPKVGWVRTRFHRALEGKVRNVTVSRAKSGRYHVSFQVEVEQAEPICCGEMVGIDVGLKHFAVLSDGRRIANPRNLRQAERRLRRLQRQLSGKQKSSQGWEKQRLKVARQHEKVANRRLDFQHKLSRSLVDEYGFVALEDLHIQGMMKNHRLAKHISDASWGGFVSLLAYKGAWYGCQVQSSDRWYPSSKICSACGAEMEAMSLRVREWQCPRCSAYHDRDRNAAINILISCCTATTVGTTERHAGGVRVRPDWIRQGL